MSTTWLYRLFVSSGGELLYRNQVTARFVTKPRRAESYGKAAVEHGCAFIDFDRAVISIWLRTM